MAQAQTQTQTPAQAPGPASAAPVPTAPAAASPVPAAPPEPRFDIVEFVVQGNTVLLREVIETAVYPFLGEQRRFADVEAAREALERAYRERGYATVSVEIPEQRADQGEIILNVLEGRIARTRVTGSRHFSQGFILERVAQATEGQVPHLPTLQEELGSVNRTADRRVLPVLRPGREPGTTEIDLQVEDRLPLHGSVEASNRQSPNTTASRLSASVRYDNLFQRDHALALTAQTTPEKPAESQALGLTYSMPLRTSGQDTLVFSANRTRGEVEAGVANTFVRSKSLAFGVRRNFSLQISSGPQARYQLLTVGAEWRDLDETVFAGEDQGFSTPLNYLPLTASYFGSFDDAQGRWVLGAGLTAGVRGLVGTDGQFATRRFRANANFAVLRLDATREHKLGEGLNLRARADMQLAGQPLVPSEQFSAGGAESVRGYLESAVVGDQGLRGTIELRSSELAPKAWAGALTSFTLLGFVEGAGTFTAKPLPGQARRFGLLAAGVGLRAKAPWLSNLAVDFGWPLRDLVTGVKSDGSGLAVGSTSKGDLRVHATASLEF